MAHLLHAKRDSWVPSFSFRYLEMISQGTPVINGHFFLCLCWHSYRHWYQQIPFCLLASYDTCILTLDLKLNLLQPLKDSYASRGRRHPQSCTKSTHSSPLVQNVQSNNIKMTKHDVSLHLWRRSATRDTVNIQMYFISNYCLWCYGP